MLKYDNLVWQVSHTGKNIGIYLFDKLIKAGAEEVEKAAIAREIATNSGLSDKGVHMDSFDGGVLWGGGGFTF